MTLCLDNSLSPFISVRVKMLYNLLLIRGVFNLFIQLTLFTLGHICVGFAEVIVSLSLLHQQSGTALVSVVGPSYVC